MFFRLGRIFDFVQAYFTCNFDGLCMPLREAFFLPPCFWRKKYSRVKVNLCSFEDKLLVGIKGWLLVRFALNRSASVSEIGRQDVSGEQVALSRQLEGQINKIFYFLRVRRFHDGDKQVLGKIPAV